MKKVLLFILLLFPISVEAGTKVISHLINAEIEIAGALNIKELIIVESDAKTFSRTINYKNNDKVWDQKTINFKSSPIYNGYSLENLKISAFKAPEEVDFNNFIDSDLLFFKELDPKTKSTEFFTKVNNPLGANINIGYDSSKNIRTAYYIEYIVTNVIVSHKDIKELYYTFLNLNYNSEETLIRLILPYSTDSDLLNVWLHGPSNGEFNYLVDSSEETIGVIASFKNLNSQVTFRVTLPREQIGIDIYLNKSKQKALDQIIKIENTKIKNENLNIKILKNIKRVIITLSLIYVVGSLSILKFPTLKYTLLYLFFGILIMFFNYIYKLNNIYIHFIFIAPIVLFLINKLRKK